MPPRCGREGNQNSGPGSVPGESSTLMSDAQSIQNNSETINDAEEDVKDSGYIEEPFQALGTQLDKCNYTNFDCRPGGDAIKSLESREITKLHSLHINVYSLQQYKQNLPYDKNEENAGKKKPSSE
ncbi:hypothetical protein HOLleu_38351 [Holothuria leucospilota]|uniref:Uncharacterized protein n=1 Tax=Holothuria leucospilota TaxID=206669 RepID=A0A9Q0YE93_HOLLE|nr:hypothetical protein HOLleu_38351 [Holothuria leucospilota]